MTKVGPATDASPGREALPRRPRPWRALVVVLLAAAAVSVLLKSIPLTPLRAVEFTTFTPPAALPSFTFHNSAGEKTSLDEHKGQFVLLNIWATWCAPCREEMPSLDRLSTRFADADLRIIPLSIDAAGLPAVQEFYRQIRIQHLPAYNEPTSKAASLLGAGIPMTFLLNREGHVIARLIGPADWDDPRMVDAIGKMIGASQAK